MRIRLARAITFAIFVLNVVVLYHIWKHLSSYGEKDAVERRHISHQKVISQNLEKHDIINSITLVIRNFEFFENDILGTLDSFISKLKPNLNILVVSDTLPYPPLNLKLFNSSNHNVHLVTLQLELYNQIEARNPLSYIKSKYVLFVPDSTRLPSEQILQNMITELRKQRQSLIAVPYASSSKSITCLRQLLNLREWTLKYEIEDSEQCDAIQGKHAILVEAQTLRRLPEPFMRPFPELLYLQTAAHSKKVSILRDHQLIDGRMLFPSHHAQWKVKTLEHQRRALAFKQLGIKRVMSETGTTEWYGCNKKTARCFGTVLKDMPEYLLAGRWTPPCCLEALRKTARHVFGILEEAGVRYWLEGGSLLGAMRSADIIPWDYDVDLGIYEEDVSRCSWLAEATHKSVVDEDGYVWERAQPSEGGFYRVHYSQSNRLHVDIFPFRPTTDGKMTKDYWFPTHPQDREFPEHFLHPMSSIEFVGRQVSAPNNIRDFLELKFGKGAIEKPQYPDPKMLKFKDPYPQHNEDEEE